MVVNMIKKEIPSSFSEKGGCSYQIVNKITVPLETSVHEAKESMMVTGDEIVVLQQVTGILKSMAEGVQRDGHARQLGDFLTVYAQPYGEIDLDKGWDEEKNGFYLKARLLNECEIDITNWVVRDVTKGRKAFKLSSVSTGESDGELELGKVLQFNGSDLPAPADARITWAVEGTDKSGTIATAKVTGTCDRYDIAADALDELKSAEYDAKTIVFTVRGNFAKASIKAKLKYVAPALPTLTGFNSDGQSGDQVKLNAKKLVITGTNLANIERSDVSLDCVDDPVTIPATATFTATATEIVIDNGNEAFTFGGTGGDDLKVTVTKYGSTVTKKATLID